MNLLDKYKELLKSNQKATIAVTLVVLFLLLAVASNTANAASSDTSCTPPTQRADGSPLPASEIAGYKWFVNGVEVQQTTDCNSFWLLAGQEGALDVQATTVDTGGRESAMSPVTVKTFITALPNPPMVQ